MPLIDIQTDLKSLTYGEFGSAEPLVIKDINSNPSPNGIHLEATKRVDDLKRITKLLTSTPAGLKHTANQAMLNTLEQSIITKNKGKSAAGKLLRGLGGTAKQLASTLAQVPVSGTGLHFVEGFSGKLGYLEGVRGHIEYKNNKNEDGNIKTIGVIEQKGNFEENKSNLVLDYFSKEITGTGATTQRSINLKNDLESKSFPINGDGSFEDIGLEGYSSKSTDRKHNSFELESSSFQSADASKPYDAITAKAPHTSSIEGAQEEIKTDTGKVYDDLIKFRFKIITPGSTEGAQPEITHIQFRAFLDSFQDDYNASWNTFKYIGRAEDFSTYGGFGRSVSFSFKVAAFSAKELQPMYDKLNLLAGSLAPTYVGSSYMRGNFVALTIGDYLVNQTGYLTTVGLSWNTTYPVGGRNPAGGDDDEGRANDKELFQVLDVNCAFTPVHKFNTTFGSQFINDHGNVLGAITPKQNSTEQQNG